MAGFQVSINGRIWVSTEDRDVPHLVNALDALAPPNRVIADVA